MLYGAMNLPVRPVLKELEDISALGFDYLELTMDAPRAHHSVIRKQKKQLLAALAQYEMKLVCHLPTFVSTADPAPGLREASLRETLDSLEMAADLHALKVFLHPSMILGLSVFVIHQARKYAMESLETIVKRAEALGVNLCLENLFPQSHSLVDPDDFVEVFKKFSGLKMTLDIGHANIGDRGGKRAMGFITTFGDRIGHIHASDNFGKEDNHLPIGTGVINFSKIMKALKAVGYDDTITLEVFSRDKDYLRISREKLAAMVIAAENRP